MIEQFEVRRSGHVESRLSTAEPSDLADGQIRCSVDRFAYTANNITYAVAGDFLRYWQFFPTLDGDAEWGVIPVWGFADVAETRAENVEVGDRLYGYFPPATEVVMTPTAVSSARLMDGSEHRSSLPPQYNFYRRVSADAGNDHDAATALLAPLHLTSYSIADALRRTSRHGADSVVIVSASSKTSLGLAYALRHGDDDLVRERPARVVGLTSVRNVDFVEGTEMYDEVCTYDDIASLDVDPIVVVDMAGNSAVGAAIVDRFGEQLRWWMAVGITHWDAGAGVGDTVPPDRREMFFAPSVLGTIIEELGIAEFEDRTQRFLAGSAAATFEWMEVDDRTGLLALEEVHPAVCDGSYPASSGLMISL